MQTIEEQIAEIKAYLKQMMDDRHRQWREIEAQKTFTRIHKERIDKLEADLQASMVDAEALREALNEQDPRRRY